MTTKIKKFDIRAFRGIPELELPLEGQSLLIRGDNGTGKSSIVDALEFFFRGRVSHLEGVQGLSVQRHVPHVSFESGDVEVCITFDPGNVAVVKRFTGTAACPPQLEEYFGVARSGVFILRRAQLLDFIISKPADRFKSIGSIIGIGDLDIFELELMRLRDNLEVKVESGKSSERGLNSELSSLLGREIKSETDIVAGINDSLKSAGLPTIAGLEDVEKHAETILGTVRREGVTRRLNSLEELSRLRKEEPKGRQAIISTVEYANAKISNLLKEENRRERAIASLLEAGRSVIQDLRMEDCPLCEQKIDPEVVLTRINGRLSLVTSLAESASEVRKTCGVVKDQLDEIWDSVVKTVNSGEDIEELREERKKLSEKTIRLKALIDTVASAGKCVNVVETEDLDKLLGEIADIVDAIREKCLDLFANEKITDQEKEVLRLVGLMTTAKIKASELGRLLRSLEKTRRNLGVARKLFSIFAETKRARVQEVFDVIQEDMRKFYALLHPDDPHKNIELRLATERRASVELRIESFGRQREDPRAFGSEGHLDSLGLCVFLALVKKFNEGCSLMVLDDVVTTVDIGHREKICVLLDEEFREKQMIITTHEEIWYGQLRSSQRVAGEEGNWRYITIQNWDVERGPIVRPYKPRWNRIEEKLMKGDKTAGNEARTYLEWALECICDALESSVPFRASREYDIGILLTSAKRRTADLVRDDDFTTSAQRSFENVERTAIYGNIVSHNNPLVDSLSVEEVAGFCRAVHGIYGQFLCPSCGNLMRCYRDLGILRCSNRRCKTPLEVKTR